MKKALPIDTIFKLPSSIPSWPPGKGFASGIIDLGGLQLSQVSTFTKVWATYQGGPNDQGATFFEPSLIPAGFLMLGSYCQSNHNPLFGWVLVASDVTEHPSNEALTCPIDYTLVWSSKPSKKLNQNVPAGYIWLPTPREGYKSVGHVVTTSPKKPSLTAVRCVRSYYTVECDRSEWIWGEESNPDEVNVYGLKPRDVRGSINPGTFVALRSEDDKSNPSLFCLKSINYYKNSFAAMPNLAQIKYIIQAYLPSSINVDFANVAQLYPLCQDDPNPNPIPIPIPVEPNGSKDGSEAVYLLIKPMLGATFTDIEIWTCNQFNNNPATAKEGFAADASNINGGHVGKRKNLTVLRVSNFDGVLYSVYFKKHNGSGAWMDSPSLEFATGSNKFVVHESLDDHSSYPSPRVRANQVSNVVVGQKICRESCIQFIWRLLLCSRG